MRRTGVWALCGALILFALDGVGGALLGLHPLWLGAVGLLGIIVAVLAGLWVYRSLIMRRWAAREPIELTGPGKGGNLGLGVLIGVLFMLVCFGIALLMGAYRITGTASLSAAQIINLVGVVLVSMFLEELIFRGVLLQALERWLGWVPALAITSVLFGAAHLLNGFFEPGVTLLAALAIAVEAGFFLGAAFLWRRSLWLVIGIHAGWNATESLLGIPVSGVSADGLLRVAAHGNVFLTGGEFGIEASVTPMVVGALVGTCMLILRSRRTKTDA